MTSRNEPGTWRPTYFLHTSSLIKKRAYFSFWVVLFYRVYYTTFFPGQKNWFCMAKSPSSFSQKSASREEEEKRLSLETFFLRIDRGLFTLFWNTAQHIYRSGKRCLEKRTGRHFCYTRFREIECFKACARGPAKPLDKKKKSWTTQNLWFAQDR